MNPTLHTLFLMGVLRVKESREISTDLIFAAYLQYSPLPQLETVNLHYVYIFEMVE